MLYLEVKIYVIVNQIPNVEFFYKYIVDYMFHKFYFRIE